MNELYRALRVLHAARKELGVPRIHDEWMPRDLIELRVVDACHATEMEIIFAGRFTKPSTKKGE